MTIVSIASVDGESDGTELARLGAAMYGQRLARGLSLRKMAQRLGMSAHSGLMQYEKGHRLPPADIVAGYERVLGISDDALRQLHTEVLAEQAKRKVQRLLASNPQPRPDADERFEPAAHPTASPTIAAAHQLPGVPPDFTGRGDQLATARELATSTGRPRVLVVSGKPGVGKTTFALAVAHQLTDQDSELELYVELRGVGPRPVAPTEVLGWFLRALNVPDHQIPATVDERATLYRTLLRDKRATVVLDNAADEAQVRPLLPGTAGCIVLITSRNALRGLEGARRQRLDVPDQDDAVALLGRIVGRDRIDAEPDLSVRLVALCGNLPLGVRIVGNRLLDWPSWTFEYLVDRLTDRRRRLDLLRAGDLDVRAAFTLSYDGLSPAGRTALRRFSLVPTAEFGIELAARLADCTAGTAEELLDELTVASLVTPAGRPGCYRLHDLLSLYAREILAQEEGAAAVITLVRSTMNWLLEMARAAALALEPSVEDSPPFNGRGPALSWLDTEWDNILAAIRWAAQTDEDRATVGLASPLSWYFDLRCRWLEWQEVATLALTAARRHADADGEVEALNSLGLAHWGLRDFTAAAECHEQALKLATTTGNALEQGRALDKLGLAFWGLGRFEEAADCHEQDRRICRRLGDRWGEAAALNHRGYALRMLTRHAEAVDCHKQALVTLQQLKDQRGAGMAWSNLGLALCGLAQFEQASDCLAHAHRIFGQVDDHWASGFASYGMGVAAYGTSRYGDAARHCTEAIGVFGALGDRYWLAQSLWTQAVVFGALGRDLDAAKQRHQAELLFAGLELHWDGLESVTPETDRKQLPVADGQAFLAGGGVPGPPPVVP